MGRVMHTACGVADVEIGMMVFSVGNPGRGVNEGHRLVVIPETESLDECGAG